MRKNKKIKVAFCVPNFIIGGVETIFITTVSELLKNKNIDITVITHAKVREPLYVDWFKSHPEIHTFVYYPLCNWFEDLRPRCRGILKPLRKIIFSLYKRYRRIIWRNKFNKNIDVFIDYKNFEFFRELRHINKPKVAWFHGSFNYLKSGRAASRLHIYDKIVGITENFVDDFRAEFPEYADKIVSIYNAIDVDAIQKKAKIADCPQQEYFCHVSRLVEGKDIKTLLDAFDLFYKKHKGVKLYIVGDGDKADEFKSYAKQLKSNKNVVFTGGDDNPYGIMKGATANILSSENEGFGMVLIESMALSRPVISSNCKSGAAEILGQGKFGLLFEVGNAKQLCECMEKIYTDKDLSKRLVKDAYKSLKRFDLSKISEQITDFIYKVKEG